MTRAKKALSQAVLLISGAIMLGFGAMRGEVETVLSKAIRLCLEQKYPECANAPSNGDSVPADSRIAKEDYIFQNRKGGAFSKSTFNEQMKKYCAACDIQNGEYLFKSHDYRHTVATNLYDHGVSRQGIRDYLGHNYEEMTMQYIDYMPKKIARRNEEYFSDEKNSLLSYVQKGEKDQ